MVTTHFRTEPDSSIRSTLLNIAWQTNSSDAFPLMAEALNDTEPRVWKEALDGLVTLGGTTALDVIRQGSGRTNAEKAEWLDEAIEQITDAMNDPGTLRSMPAVRGKWKTIER